MWETEAFKSIEKQTRERYSNRLKASGYSPRTLGWGSKDMQQYRFLQTLGGGVGFNGKTVVDIGCGFGDYFSFLQDKQAGIRKYLGVDVNDELLAVARQKHPSQQAEFAAGNLMTSPPEKPLGDIGVMLGVLNFNLKSEFDNEEYSRKFIKNALAAVNEVLIVDFLSAKRAPEYPAEGFVYYHEPARMLEFALSLSPDVVLKHDYLPIPQKEFMLFIRKGAKK